MPTSLVVSGLACRELTSPARPGLGGRPGKQKEYKATATKAGMSPGHVWQCWLV